MSDQLQERLADQMAQEQLLRAYCVSLVLRHLPGTLDTVSQARRVAEYIDGSSVRDA